MDTMDTASSKLDASTVRARIRRFPRTFAPYRRELVRRYGEAAATRLEEATGREYAALLPRTPRFPGRLNLFNWVMGFNALIVAMFKAMAADGRTAEESARVLYAVAEDQHGKVPRVFRWVARQVFFSRPFLRLARQSARRVRGHPGGWDIDYEAEPGRPGAWAFTCSRCGVVDYLRANGAADLAPYCNYVDYLQSKTFALGMRNPSTIGCGSPVCRESFQRGRATPLPANLHPVAGESAEA